MPDPKTIRVQSSDPMSQGDFILINEADFDANAHVLCDEKGVAIDAPDAVAGMRIAKGPRGKFYVKNGKDNLAGPFETQDEADAALAGMQPQS